MAHIRIGEVTLEGNLDEIMKLLRFNPEEYYYSSGHKEFFKISEMDDNHLKYAVLELLDNEIQVYRNSDFNTTFNCLVSGRGTGNRTLLAMVKEGYKRCQF